MSGPGASARIDHVAVAVRDADAALAWWAGTLGLRVVHDEVVDGPGSRLVHLRGADGPDVQLVQPLRANPVQEFLDTRGEGLHHVCFAVDDVDAALAGLGQDVPTFVGGRGRPACFLRGVPAGVEVELVGPVPQERAAGC